MLKISSLNEQGVRVVAAFPTLGKSYAKVHAPLFLVDLDSAHISRENFPEEYITHIKRALQMNPMATVLVSTDLVVLQALTREGIAFALFRPENTPQMKEEVLKRMRYRQSPRELVNLVDRKWEEFSDDMTTAMTGHPERVQELTVGQYLTDFI